MNKEIKIGYKIVRVFDDNYWSSFINPLQIHNSFLLTGMIAYRFNEFVKPHTNCGSLCVFNNLDIAKKYLKYNYSQSTHKIFKCEYIRSCSVKIFVNNTSEKYIQNLPDGTILACAVKLIEEINV